MFKGIIFDCFGVLLGSGFWNVYESLGGDVSKDAAFIDEYLNQADLGLLSPDDFRTIIARRLGVSAEQYKDAFRKDEVPNEELFEYIKDELQPRYKLAMVSNATGESVRRKIPEDKLSLFDEVFISEEDGLLKPDPRLFRLALDKLGTKPEETLFIDDHQEYIDGAEAVGLKTQLFTNVTDLRLILDTARVT